MRNKCVLHFIWLHWLQSLLLKAFTAPLTKDIHWNWKPALINTICFKSFYCIAHWLVLAQSHHQLIPTYSICDLSILYVTLWFGHILFPVQTWRKSRLHFLNWLFSKGLHHQAFYLFSQLLLLETTPMRVVRLNSKASVFLNQNNEAKDAETVSRAWELGDSSLWFHYYKSHLLNSI